MSLAWVEERGTEVIPGNVILAPNPEREEATSTRWCTRCPASGSRFRAKPGDFMCKVCRSFQSWVDQIVHDPCDQILLAILGNPPGHESSTDYRQIGPASPKVLASIRLAMDGKGAGKWAELAKQLLAGEVELVLSALNGGRNE